MANQKHTRSSNYVDFSTASSGSATSSVNTPVPLDPTKLPPVANRPTVAPTNQQAPATAAESVAGGIAGFMDRFVPDDMGGVLRGDSGWTSHIPGYNQTLGAVADVALTSGSGLVNALTWGTEQMNHLGAALLSAAPGGIQTLDWSQAHDVSVGQVAVANAGAALRDARHGNFLGAALSSIGSGVLGAGAIAIDQNNASTRDDFNILNPTDRKSAFVDSTAGSWGSGLTDAVWSVAADPTIVGGKASAILRTGLKVGEFGGLTNQALRTANQINVWGSKLDEGLKYTATGGKEGLWSAEAEHVKALATEPVHLLEKNPLIKSSSRPEAALRLVGQVTRGDTETMTALAKAMAGMPEGWVALRARNLDLYDQLATVHGVNIYDRLPGAAALSDDQLAMGSEHVANALLRAGENAPTDVASQAAGQLINRGGNTLSPSMARAANAYRRGSLKNQFGVASNGPRAVVDAPIFPKAQWLATTLESAAGSRPVRVVRWFGQSAPSGILHIKNGDNHGSLQELSAWLRKSTLTAEQSADIYTRYIGAADIQARKAVVTEMEGLEVSGIAARNGVTPEAAKMVYDSYVKERGRHLQSMQSRGKDKPGFAVGEDDALVTTPNLYTELDESVPLLHQETFNRVTKKNAGWLNLHRTQEDFVNVADTVNTWWKLSVLLRLGYTERNITEGALRSVAALGAIAANPKAFVALPANTYHYASSLGLRRSIKAHEGLLNKAHENLQTARQAFIDAHVAAKTDEWKQALADVTEHNKALKAMPSATKRTKKEQQAYDATVKKRDKAQAIADDLRKNHVDPASPNLSGLQKAQQEQLAKIDALSAQIKDLHVQFAAKNSKRKIGGYSGNVMSDGTVMDGAFQKSEGRMAAVLSSADQTVHETINNGFASRHEALKSSGKYEVLDPKTMKASDVRRYFDELAVRYNQKYRNDAMIKMWLANDGDPEILQRTKEWLMSEEGAWYRKSMTHGANAETGLKSRLLEDKAGIPNETAIEEYLTEVYRQYQKELPADLGIRARLLEDSMSPSEISAYWGSRELPAIPARSVADNTDRTFARLHSAAQSATDTLMKGLGSIPETKLLRHPFYNSVYKRRQNEMYDLAHANGADMGSPLVKARINRAAHADALKATKSTMYTIDRLSNSATMLRWVSPFFPAFENSIRTWTRMTYENPAILGYGNLLWNIPNNLGWVVDKNGDKVPHSNMFRDEGNYIVWPQAMSDFLSKATPFTPGESIKTRQAGFNVIFPGGEPWFPGVGPMTQIPTAIALRNRPEAADVLRSMMSQEMFTNIVPNGDPNTDLVSVILPTWAKRVKQMMTGTNEDGAYLTVMQQMVEDEYITAQLENRTVTPADMKRVEQKAQHFYTWQMASALTLPAGSTVSSKYAVQRNAWQKLIDDTSLSYDQKLEQFTKKYGNSFDAITRSGSTSEYGLQPNLSTWQKISSNPDLVNQLAAIDPQIVGMFGNMGSFDDPFSYSVYTELKNLKIGSDAKGARHQLSPDELLRNNEISDGWKEWKAIQSAVNEKAVAAGFKSINQKGAEFYAGLEATSAEKLGAKYPAWAQERKAYVDKLPAFITGAREIVKNANLVKEDSTVSALAEYLQIRDAIAAKKKNVSNTDARASIDQIGYAAAQQLRNSDIGFADLYDRYFTKDDFRVV